MPASKAVAMNSADTHRSNDILCLAPNAAYQLTVLFDKITLGDVNRASMQTNSLGGKGQNFAVATKQYYKNADRVTLLQILGGPTGTQIEAMEDEQGFDYITVRTSLPTRTCTTCLDMSTGDMTEMVGVSGLIDEHAEEEYEQVATQILQSENPPRALALCGTFPPGLQSTTVSRIIQARTEKTLVFVDAVKDIHPVLESKCIDILKVNSGEVLNILSALEPAYQDKTPKDVDLAKVAMELGQRYSIGAVAVTDGPFTAYLANVQDNKAHAFSIPDLLKDREYFLGSDQAPQGHLVLNPLGAGDTCSAVMMNHMLDDKVMVEAFAAGLAAASASCLVPMPNCVFDRKVMERIRGKMTVREIM